MLQVLEEGASWPLSITDHTYSQSSRDPRDLCGDTRGARTTSEPIELDFPGTLRFDASLWSEGRRVDERWEVGGLAASAVRCRDGADCRTIRVRLAGGGTLIASIPFAARVEVVRQVAGRMERSDGGAIAPGSYGARVMLPWMDVVAGSDTGARTTRIVEGSLAITP